MRAAGVKVIELVGELMRTLQLEELIFDSSSEMSKFVARFNADVIAYEANIDSASLRRDGWRDVSITEEWVSSFMGDVASCNKQVQSMISDVERFFQLERQFLRDLDLIDKFSLTPSGASVEEIRGYISGVRSRVLFRKSISVVELQSSLGYALSDHSVLQLKLSESLRIQIEEANTRSRQYQRVRDHRLAVLVGSVILVLGLFLKYLYEREKEQEAAAILEHQKSSLAAETKRKHEAAERVKQRDLEAPERKRSEDEARAEVERRAELYNALEQKERKLALLKRYSVGQKCVDHYFESFLKKKYISGTYKAFGYVRELPSGKARCKVSFNHITRDAAYDDAISVCYSEGFNRIVSKKCDVIDISQD